MILEVGSWALRQAAIDHRKWTEAGLRPPKIAVNVSPIQLRRRDFVSIVEKAILDSLGVEPPPNRTPLPRDGVVAPIKVPGFCCGPCAGRCPAVRW